MSEATCYKCGHKLGSHYSDGCLSCANCRISPEDITQHYVDECARLRAELERVTKERDTAVFVNSIEAETVDGLFVMLNEARAEAVKWYKRCLEARKIASQMYNGEDKYDATNYSEDIFVRNIFGTGMFKWCQYCGGNIRIESSGKFRCHRCGK